MIAAFKGPIPPDREGGGAQGMGEATGPFAMMDFDYFC